METNHLAARKSFPWLGAILALALVALGASCGKKPAGQPSAAAVAQDPQLSARGSFEVTAELVEIPEGAIFKRDLYDYATVLKYRVIKVHRGQVAGDTIYVAQYNPFKPRNEAADARVKDIGGNVRTFQPARSSAWRLEAPVEDHFMGGLVNKYFGKTTDPIYWAVWTNLAGP